MANNPKVKKGQRILFSDGEYSNYGVCGLFEAKSDFCLDHQLQEFLKENPEQKANHMFCSSSFVGFLFCRRLVEDTDYREVHLGSYGTAPEEWG